jgi:hypothetical protein
MLRRESGPAERANARRSLTETARMSRRDGFANRNSPLETRTPFDDSSPFNRADMREEAAMSTTRKTTPTVNERNVVRFPNRNGERKAVRGDAEGGNGVNYWRVALELLRAERAARGLPPINEGA